MVIIFVFYSIFDALYLSVVLDFPFLRLNQYLEIVKFVYSTNKLLKTNKLDGSLRFVTECPNNSVADLL